MDEGGAKKESEPKINNFGSATLVFHILSTLLRELGQAAWTTPGWDSNSWRSGVTACFRQRTFHSSADHPQAGWS